EVLAVRFADSARYRTLHDLSGRRVATLGGTGAYQMLLDLQGNGGPIVVSYDDDVHPYEDLVAGRVDAVLLDNIIAERSLRRLGGFVIQPERVAVGHYVAVFARRNAALRDSADAILRARMRDGSLEKTFRAWNVWSDDEARYFGRVAAASSSENVAAATTPATVPATAPAAAERSIRAYLPSLA